MLNIKMDNDIIFNPILIYCRVIYRRIKQVLEFVGK